MLIGFLTLAAHAGQPLDDCQAIAVAPETVLLTCGDETAWFSDRPAGTLETVLVEFSNAWVRQAGVQMTSTETQVIIGATSYRGFKVTFPDSGKRHPTEGVLVAQPILGGMRAAGCVSAPYGVTCERMLQALLADGLPAGLPRRSATVWLDVPLEVPPGCAYGEMGNNGGGISCGENLLVWVNTRTRTEAEQAIADTFHGFAAELGGTIGTTLPCTVGGVKHTCQTLLDDTGVRAWFTAVEIGEHTAFQYCLSETADAIPPVCAQVLSVP